MTILPPYTLLEVQQLGECGMVHPEHCTVMDSYGHSSLTGTSRQVAQHFHSAVLSWRL